MDACKVILNWVSVSSNSQVSTRRQWKIVLNSHPQPAENLQGCFLLLRWLVFKSVSPGGRGALGLCSTTHTAATGQCIFPPPHYPATRVSQPWFWPGFSWQFVAFISFTEQFYNDRPWISPDLSYSWILMTHNQMQTQNSTKLNRHNFSVQHNFSSTKKAVARYRMQ